MRDRQSYLDASLALIEEMPIESLLQLVSYALDCLTHPAIYGQGKPQPAGYREALVALFKRTHALLPDKAVGKVLTLALRLQER